MNTSIPKHSSPKPLIRKIYHNCLPTVALNGSFLNTMDFNASERHLYIHFHVVHKVSVGTFSPLKSDMSLKKCLVPDNMLKICHKAFQLLPPSNYPCWVKLILSNCHQFPKINILFMHLRRQDSKKHAS